MTLALQSRAELTVEEFFHGDYDGYELIRGQLVEKSMGAMASYTSIQFSTELVLYLRGNPIASAFDSEQMFACFPDSLRTSRKPDVSAVLNARLPDGLIPAGNFRLRPDLAFESVSKHDNARKLEEKLMDYVSVGIPLIWVVYPEGRIGRVFREDGSSVIVREDHVLDGGSVLPGFKVPLSAILPPEGLVEVDQDDDDSDE